MKTRAVILVAVGVLVPLLLINLLKAEKDASAQSTNLNREYLPFTVVQRGSDSDYDDAKPMLLAVCNLADYASVPKRIAKSPMVWDVKLYDLDYIYFFVMAGKGSEAVDVLRVSQTVNNDTGAVRTIVHCRVRKNGHGYPQTSSSPWCAVKVSRKEILSAVVPQVVIQSFVLSGQTTTMFEVVAERP